MDLQIQGRVALVLGASSGLGSAIAQGLAREGVKVVLAARRKNLLDELVLKIEANGGQAMAVAWDLFDHSVIDKNIGLIEEKWGVIDILVNNSGGPAPSSAIGQSTEVWQNEFNGMVLSLIKITDRILPGMKKSSWGRIITCASSGVVSPIPNLAISNALRMTLLGWSKTLAMEVAKDGITANVVLPGRISTNRLASLDEARAKRENVSVDAVIANSLKAIPVGRYGEPQEFADMVVFLSSQRAAYVTGSVFRVDGGMISSI
jgi:3-oxoacyl-[acyl-carrier protein] reductase